MPPDPPSLDRLVNHLAACPTEFFQPSDWQRRENGVATLALLSDLFDFLGLERPSEGEKSRWFLLDQRSPARASLIHLATWLMFHPVFQNAPLDRATFATFCTDHLAKLAQWLDGPGIHSDQERTEEFVRLCLQAAGMIPMGESLESARDRLQALDTVELHHVMQETQASETRAQAIREALARKAAEAVPTYSQE